MRRPIRLIAAVAAAIALAACERSTPTAPTDDAAFKSGAGEGQGQFVSAMTRNLYLGTDIGVVLTAPPQQVPLFVGAALAEVDASMPAERMGRIADEIAARRPDLVGLQEVSRFLTQSPGDALAGNPVAATEVRYDFLDLLMAALAERGARYEVAAVNVNADVELPAVTPAGLIDARLVDRDVILVRRDVRVLGSASANFSVALPLQIGPVSLSFLRGWSSVDVQVRGRGLRFFNAHLETQAAPPVNVAQGQELLAIASASPLPVVLAGDFNSAANAGAPPPSVTPTYGLVLASGYTDLWAAAEPGDPGLTCCHAVDLMNPAGIFSQRIDFLFFGPRLAGAGGAEVFGEEPGDRTASGLWPSDHAGVFGTIRLP